MKGKKEDPSKTSDAAVVVGTNRRGRRFKQLLVVLVIVLVAVGAGLAVRWWQEKDSAEAPALPPTIEKSQNMASSGDFDAAHDEISKALRDSSLTSQERYELYFQQGATYFNEAKYAEALKSYKQAAAIQETQSLYESMAVAAEQLGDKTAAMAYYRKAIELVPGTNPVGGADKESYEAHIQELEAQP